MKKIAQLFNQKSFIQIFKEKKKNSLFFVF